ncbi:hypothetical protein N7492_006340 [Penicillium capsulatum]|uniref:Pre-rRNA-processing protein ESF2 n=1 Tax=Penicillium capsulatum TaxID=69766 RepID=A0A9W9LLM1_9EURO|nr:hypothetical protein N7492_006340 [Penicillium capsulatum]KAJ6108989.1 hypothetical protein N7512_008826 [Penicillium capsulatum]
MTTRTHNEFLDIPASDDEASDGGYDSESKAESKGRAVKRRRQDYFNPQSDDDDRDEEDEEEADSRTELAKGRKKSRTKIEPASDDQDEGGASLTARSPSAKTPTKSKTHPLKVSKKKKTGVVYLSSLPPYLKPHSLKKMIEARGFAPITKIFLAPLVPSNSGAKRRSNKRKLYTDGWIEFASKKTAKIAAETLNANIIGVCPTIHRCCRGLEHVADFEQGRKGSYYHDDVWNMKYLRGFTWNDLMEQMQIERSQREAQRKIEDSRARKEEKMFVAGVEAGQVADGIARKNEEKRKRKTDAGEGDDEERRSTRVRRRFVQNDVVAAQPERTVLGDDAKRVLGKIF